MNESKNEETKERNGGANEPRIDLKHGCLGYGNLTLNESDYGSTIMVLGDLSCLEEIANLLQQPIQRLSNQYDGGGRKIKGTIFFEFGNSKEAIMAAKRIVEQVYIPTFGRE